MQELLTEADCRTCGQCCDAGMTIEVSAVEKDFIADGGAEFTTVVPPPEVIQTAGSITASEVEPPRGLIRLRTDCGYKRFDGKQFSCAVYNNARRPKACASFERGGTPCTTLRAFNSVRPARRLSLVAA